MKRLAGLKLWAAGALALLSCGCMSVDYIGQHYESTEKVVWFNDGALVPPDTYRTIGKATLTAPDGYSSNDIRDKLIAKARDVGADAVQVVDSERRATTSYTTAAGERPTMQPTGMSASNGWNPDGSRTSVNSFGQSEVNGEQVVTRYEMVVRVYFLRLDSRFAPEPAKAAPKEKPAPRGIELQPIEPERNAPSGKK